MFGEKTHGKSACIRHKSHYSRLKIISWESIGVGVGIGIGIELFKTDTDTDSDTNPENSPGVAGY
jgi:hypothetical protein